MCSSDNWTYAALDFLGGRKGLTDEFNYQTVCLHILSGILYKATKMKTVDFANAFLFGPLGIEKHINYLAETAEEHKQFTTGKLPKENIWFCDTDGLGTPEYGLCMSAEDMAKIGLLCLNKGIYDNKRILSSKWIEEMKSPRTVESNHFRGMEYGYLWWIIDRKKNIYAANRSAEYGLPEPLFEEFGDGIKVTMFRKEQNDVKEIDIDEVQENKESANEELKHSFVSIGLDIKEYASVCK